METITISVLGEELETISVELTKEEVGAIYKIRRELSFKVAELEKELDTVRKNKQYSEDRLMKANEELEQAHTLFTALGVQAQTDHEESYYRKNLPIVARLGLYIAQGLRK